MNTMNTVYAHVGDKQLIRSPDGCVGLWNPEINEWVERWGLGTNHAGFVREMLSRTDNELTDAGREWLRKRLAALAAH